MGNVESDQEKPTEEEARMDDDSTNKQQNKSVTKNSKVITCEESELQEDENEEKQENTGNETCVDELVDRINKRSTWQPSKRKHFVLLSNKESEMDNDDSSFADDVEGDSDSDDEFVKRKQKRRPRGPYSRNEDVKLLRYVVDHHLTAVVKGRHMWTEMEKEKVLDRTWQSMKERYLKRILPNMWTFVGTELSVKEAEQTIRASNLDPQKMDEWTEKCRDLSKKVPRLLK